jgi:hypothetical protein
LSVWQNGVLGRKGVVLVSVSANEICFYSAARVSTKGLEVNHRFELKALMSEVCTKKLVDKFSAMYGRKLNIGFMLLQKLNACTLNLLMSNYSL